MKQKLWIVTELYYPEVTSTGYYLTQIAEGLAEDFEVGVLCGQPNYSARGVRALKEENHKNVQIFRVNGTTLNKNKIIFKLINMLSLSFFTFFKALKLFGKGDKILVVTTPPTLPFIVALASLIRGSSYTLLIHDNYPEILFAVNKLKENSFAANILDHFNRWLYKYASKIIVVGRDMKILLERKTEGLDIPIATIPNWAELETVEPLDRSNNILLKELDLEEKLVFLYAGNMGYPNDLESIVSCAEMLLNDKRFHFIFLGAGVKKTWLEREVSAKQLVNITILDPKPRSEQNIFLNACDVAIVSLVPKMWGVSMPSRTYNILAAGKPVLALTENNSEIAQVVDENKVGWNVVPNDALKLKETILAIFDAKAGFFEMGKRARSAALEQYSVEKAVQSYKAEI